MNNISSFASASVFPVKLIKQVRHYYRGGKLYPHHVQISLTNRCNLNCEFCSCSKRDGEQELPLDRAMDIMGELHNLGARSLTITGGGEPLMYPHLLDFVMYCKCLGIEMGLVSNGFLFDTLEDGIIDKMTWVRISVGDDRDISKFLSSIVNVVEENPQVDWAFSYVVTRNYNPDKLEQVIRAGMDLNMTHIRVVSDLIDLDAVPDMYDVQQYMTERGVDVSRAFFQGRKRYTVGAKQCLISLVKPVVGTDGKLYPCCGIQYAMEDMALDFDPTMDMGEDVFGVYSNQAHFDGSRCARCYYNQYNDILTKIVDPVAHEEFL